MAADDRVPGALLAGLTVAALALGGWWWRESAPTVGRTDPSPSPSAGAFPQAGVRLVDPHTGQVVQGPEADPDEAVVIHEPVAPEEAEFSRSVWSERSHLAVGDDPLVRQATSAPGERQLLTVSCTGSGTLTMAFTGTEEYDTPLETTCASMWVAWRLTATGGPMLVTFTVAGGEVDLEARLASQF